MQRKLHQGTWDRVKYTAADRSAHCSTEFPLGIERTGEGSLLREVNEGPDCSLLRAIQPTPMADSESAVSELCHCVVGFLRSVDLDDW